jgi:hypothetical protein
VYIYWHPWRKLVALSAAVAAGGVLACAGALLDLWVPGASLTAFVVLMVALGLAVAGVVAAFTWLCGLWDEPFPGSSDRGEGTGEPGPRGPSSQEQRRKSLEQEQRRRLRQSPPPAYWGDRYRTTLRGGEHLRTRSAQPAAAGHRRHGQ